MKRIFHAFLFALLIGLLALGAMAAVQVDMPRTVKNTPPWYEDGMVITSGTSSLIVSLTGRRGWINTIDVDPPTTAITVTLIRRPSGAEISCGTATASTTTTLNLRSATKPQGEIVAGSYDVRVATQAAVASPTTVTLRLYRETLP
jgi:hypothetical protein